MRSHFSRVQLFATPWTAARQVPLSMGFSRQEYLSRLPCRPPGDLPDPGIEPVSPALQVDSLPLSHQGSPNKYAIFISNGIRVPNRNWQVVWYSHLFQNFPQFIVIHTDKCFGVVNKAEIDVFLERSWFSMIQRMLAIWSLVLLPFLKPAWVSVSSWFTYCWSLAWRI